MLWQVLSNKYKDHITFGVHRDRHGKSSVAMGFEQPKKGSSKVLIYPKGSTEYVLYEGGYLFALTLPLFSQVPPTCRI